MEGVVSDLAANVLVGRLEHNMIGVLARDHHRLLLSIFCMKRNTQRYQESEHPLPQNDDGHSEDSAQKYGYESDRWEES